MANRFSWFLLPTTAAALALALGGPGVPPASAAGEPVPADTATNDITTLASQLKDEKKGNEDLLQTIEALGKAFFNLAPFAKPKPEPAAADATPEDKATALKALADWEKEKSTYEKMSEAFQPEALDVLVKAVRVIERARGGKDNLRNDVNTKAATVLSELIGSPDLAKGRDAKAVAKVRSEVAKEMMGIIEKDFEKRNKDGMMPPAGLTEAAFACLGKSNDLKVLEWISLNFIRTDNAPFHVERFVAAHKAMKMFSEVPAKLRHAITDSMVTVYGGTEASTNQINDPDPKKRQQAQSAKAFWEKVKTGVIECVQYYSTAPGGAPPGNAEGQAFNTMKDLGDWWRKNDKLGRSPWVDPPKEVK